jgi:hypothetical protein
LLSICHPILSYLPVLGEISHFLNSDHYIIQNQELEREIKRLAEAERSFFHKAQEARDKAQVLLAQADELDAECQQHLQVIKRIQGAEYVLKPLRPGYDSPIGVEVRARNRVLRGDADALEVQARIRENQQPQSGAIIQEETAEELVNELLSRQLIVGPTVGQVYEWVAMQRGQGVQEKLTLNICNGRIQ